MNLSFLSRFIVENKYAAYEQRIGNVPTDALYKQMNVLEKVTDNALKVTLNKNRKSTLSKILGSTAQ